MECGLASQAIYDATLKRQVNHAALERLQEKIGELTLEVTCAALPTLNSTNVGVIRWVWSFWHEHFLGLSYGFVLRCLTVGSELIFCCETGHLLCSMLKTITLLRLLPIFPFTPPALYLLTTSSQLLEHLPHSVSGVGEELARGDPDLEPFNAVGKIEPSQLLGFVVVVRSSI